MMLFLDWEKAFDKIDQSKIIEALHRFQVDPHLINIVQSLYTDPTFYVTLNGNTSKLHTQKRGIRQGCPLSPYLFIVVMAALFHDVHENKRDLRKSQKSLETT
jgi:hypothetical protein